MLRRYLAVIMLGSLLAACGGPPPVQTTPSPAAVSEPTAAAPTASAATPPTAEPTTTTATLPTATTAAGTPTTVAGVLPAPLYALQGGQVVRIAADGMTKTPLTDEQPFAADALAITELAVSPADGALAYVLQGAKGNALIITDANGENRRVLLENVPVSAPRWSRDGSAIAVQMSQPSGSDSPWTGGLWVVSASSGEARLLQANDPPPSDGSGEAWAYAPEAWSPDGRKLLVARFSQVAEVCDAAILDVVTGELTTLQPPSGGTLPLRVQCSGGVWAADGSGIYVVLRGPGLSPPEPGLYLADAASGALEPVIPAQTADGRFALVQSQSIGPEDALLALVALVDRIPDPAVDPNAAPPAASLYRVGQDSTLEQLRPESFALYGMPVWAPGGAGAVIPTPTNDGGVAYFYVPVSGEAMRLQLEPTAGIAWGR